MSSSREVTAQKKKDVWEQAEDEFYTESYPSGSKPENNTYHRRPTRLGIPLPSHTARRGSLLQGRASKTGGRRKYSLANNTIRGTGQGGGLTLNSTMAPAEANGTTTNANDIEVAALPNLSEDSILNERKTWEELQRIKSMPVPMSQKKLLKAQLTNLPKFRMKGWSNVKYASQRWWKEIAFRLNYINRHLVFFSQSLRRIELRVGTAIGNVFLFIKWTMFLNIAVSLGMLSFVIGPYLTYDYLVGGKPRSTTNATLCNVTHEGFPVSLKDDPSVKKMFLDCCRARYLKERKDGVGDGPGGTVTRIVGLMGGGDVNQWPIHYSFYHDPYISYDNFKTSYPFATAYVLTGFAMLACCLILVVRNVAAGVREIITLREGEFYKYANLVFSGWEHFTNDPVGAQFKRRMIRNEMNLALHIEKKRITDMGKSRREKLKIFLRRVFVNLIVVALLIGAGYTIFKMALNIETYKPPEENNSSKKKKEKSFLHTLAGLSVSFVISFFNLIFPIILTKLGKLEDHSREMEIALVLLRSLFIRLFSIYALAAVYYNKAYCKPADNYCIRCVEHADRHRVPCWEGEFAAQMYTLVMVELSIKTILTFIVDPLRRLVGYCCDYKITKRIGRLSFNIIRHSLDIIYIQILSWISFFFAPFMPIVTVVYLFLIFYIKKFGVMYNVNYVPNTFRTTRTTAIFMMAKIISFVVILFTYAFIVGFMVPSRECGPFRGKETAWTAVYEEFSKFKWILEAVDWFFPGIAIPFALVLVLLSYYYYSVAQANRSMVETLRHLLILEGHDKQYLFAKLNSLRRSDPETAGAGTAKPPLHQTIFKDPRKAKRLSRVAENIKKRRESLF